MATSNMRSRRRPPVRPPGRRAAVRLTALTAGSPSGASAIGPAAPPPYRHALRGTARVAEDGEYLARRNVDEDLVSCHGLTSECADCPPWVSPVSARSNAAWGKDPQGV